MIAFVVAVALSAGGACAAAHGAVLIARAVRRADEAASVWLVRGIRGLVVAVAAWALAAGMLFAQTWLLVFGGVFLAEELYETGVVVLILRRSSAPS